MPVRPRSTTKHRAGYTRAIAIPPGGAALLHDGEPVTPRQAATVLLYRHAPELELLFVQRPGGADFAAGAWVFPGGSVHAEDENQPDPHRSAAVRELFEEAGVLFARHQGRFATADEAASVRDRVAQGRGYVLALSALGLVPAVEELVYFARWITPEVVRKRFDTRFYLAPLPEGQSVHPQPGEVVDWRWAAPRAVLEDESFNLVFATRRVLESVVAEPHLEVFIERARGLAEIAAVQPRIVRAADGSMSIEVD
ncbi:MAG TPA: NUDIX domain-containing protein [Candidatus Dormibacteraeota bacterium]